MSLRPDRPDASHGGTLFPPAALGVIGSGQLGRMFIQAAQRMGYRAGRLERHRGRAGRASGPLDGHRPSRSSAGVASLCRAGRGGDRRVRERLGPRAAVAGAPPERYVPAGGPSGSARTGSARNASWPATTSPMHPGGRSAATPSSTPRFEASGCRLILKTAASGYDGKGQVLVTEAAGAAGAWASLGRAACVAEGWVDFAAEVSVVVARGGDGRAVCYPVALNRHERHILDATLMPAPVGPIVAQEARRPGPGRRPGAGHRRRPDRRVLSERRRPPAGQRDRPAPHNSGHLTIEAAVVSQFEQQVRALCGLPLGPTDLVMPAAMVNLLGDLWPLAGGEPHWDAALGLDPGVLLHLYGKRTPAAGRKMGHLTVLDPDPETALHRALAARHALVAGQRGR